MKKFVILILFALFCVCLVACVNEQKYALDNYDWVMTTVQSIKKTVILSRTLQPTIILIRTLIRRQCRSI